MGCWRSGAPAPRRFAPFTICSVRAISCGRNRSGIVRSSCVSSLDSIESYCASIAVERSRDSSDGVRVDASCVTADGVIPRDAAASERDAPRDRRVVSELRWVEW